MVTITVLGAGRCVTGSKFLIRWKEYTLLVDCGLFQGPKANRQRNWDPLPFPAHEIDAVVLTHAHIDHSGYLPRLYRQGFRGRVHSTRPTQALLKVLLPDAAHLQEEEARYANKEGYTSHEPALPLYTVQDAKSILKQVKSVPFDAWKELHPGIRVRWRRQGHILGAASVEIRTKDSRGKHRTILFSGDVGRYGVPILREPHPYEGSDVLFLESTYGDRRHGLKDPRSALIHEVNAAVDRGGMLVIPAFAIDRTQELLYMLHELTVDREIPEIPIFLDSPMAIEATAVYTRFISEHDVEMREFFKDEENPIFLPNLQVSRTTWQSKQINAMPGPAIVVSASGMATGGRILHHLKHRLPRTQDTILFVGYQAEGTRGRELVEGAEEVTIHGQTVPVKATVEQITGLSAHADADELMLWLSRRERDPEKVVLIHGEYPAQQAFAERLRDELGWDPWIPELEESMEL